MKIKRTLKVICVENLTEDVIRKMASLGGHESHCMSMDWDRFTITNRTIGRNESGSTIANPDSRDIEKGFVPSPDGINIKIKGFDTDIVVWNNGQVQGYYNSGSGKAQYAATYLDWVNLMLEQGFYEIDNN